MDVNAIGASGLSGITALPELPRIEPIHPVTIHKPATELSPVDVVSVLDSLDHRDAEPLQEVLEPPPQPETAAQTDALVANLIQHSRVGETAHVDPLVREIAQIAPAMAERLPDHPDLTHVRPEITTTLHHVTLAAKVDAEHALADVASRVDPEHRVGMWHSQPHAIIGACEKLIAFGGLNNYRKAERLAISMRPEGMIIIDITPEPVMDPRGLEWHVTRQFDFLMRGPVLGLLFLLLAFVLIVAADWLR